MMTSQFEPFGLVLPEAMSCGLPVVAYDCPYGPASIISQGADGFLIKNNDREAFAQQMKQLMADRELRLSVGKKAAESAKRFDACRIMPQWKELFEKLCH
jgi:glycosyltransferase involved in cell wall biosynthesis